MDWSRVSGKVRFRKLVMRQDQGLKDTAELDRELQEVRVGVPELLVVYSRWQHTAFKIKMHEDARVCVCAQRALKADGTADG